MGARHSLEARDAPVSLRFTAARPSPVPPKHPNHRDRPGRQRRLAGTVARAATTTPRAFWLVVILLGSFVIGIWTVEQFPAPLRGAALHQLRVQLADTDRRSFGGPSPRAAWVTGP